MLTGVKVGDQMNVTFTNAMVVAITLAAKHLQ
jgi:hypothetical protein